MLFFAPSAAVAIPECASLWQSLPIWIHFVPDAPFVQGSSPSQSARLETTYVYVPPRLRFEFLPLYGRRGVEIFLSLCSHRRPATRGAFNIKWLHSRLWRKAV
jgi:hypothetical protein